MVFYLPIAQKETVHDQKFKDYAIEDAHEIDHGVPIIVALLL